MKRIVVLTQVEIHELDDNGYCASKKVEKYNIQCMKDSTNVQEELEKLKESLSEWQH